MDNYHVRLIAPAQMADEEIMKFQSSLRKKTRWLMCARRFRKRGNNVVLPIKARWCIHERYSINPNRTSAFVI